MLPEHEKIIGDSIQGFFSLQEKFSDFELNSNFQLLLSQLDLFKLLASLVVAIIGIGYLYNSKLDGDFLLLSLIFSLTTLIVAISYTRESIDRQPKLTELTRQNIWQKSQEHVRIVLEAKKLDDFQIYSNYARGELEEAHKNKKILMNQIGEIITFFFYLSIGFLVFSFVSSNYQVNVLSLPTLLLLIVVYLVSFKSWAICVSEKLSTPLVDFLKR